MGVEELLGAISSVGFPIVVAGFLLFRFENSIKENTKVLQSIAIKLEGEGK